MRPLPFSALLAGLLLPAAAAASASPLGTRPGDVSELTKRYETSSEDSEGSTGSSQGHDALIERVIGVRADGLELEYDLPKSDASSANWQFPVRVLRTHGGELRLLNGAELESRVDPWLKKGKMTRAACGRWIFTWNAFRIDCDPQSAIAIISAYGLAPADLHEGGLYREKEARAPATLKMARSGPEGSTFVAEMEIDPEAVRRGQAESDVVVAELSGETLSLEAAARARAKTSVSGTISVTLETDAAGSVKRRTRVVRLEIREPDGGVEKRIATETVERLPVSRADGR